MTREELEAENAALRDLLAAISELADPPKPAAPAELDVHYLECVRRIDVIAVYAKAEAMALPPGVWLSVLRNKAETVREHAARPLRYKAESKNETPAAVSA